MSIDPMLVPSVTGVRSALIARSPGTMNEIIIESVVDTVEPGGWVTSAIIETVVITAKPLWIILS